MSVMSYAAVIAGICGITHCKAFIERNVGSASVLYQIYACECCHALRRSLGLEATPSEVGAMIAEVA